MHSRFESKKILQAAETIHGLLSMMYCRQLLILAVLICSGSSSAVVLIGCAATGGSAAGGSSGDDHDSSVMGSFMSLRTVHKYSESAREIMKARYGDDHLAAASWPRE
jgi:hypothetical protein